MVVRDDGLLTVAEAARWLHISESALYASDVPWVRIGKRGRRYQIETLRAYAERRRSHEMLETR